MRVEAIAGPFWAASLHEPTIRLRSFSPERGHASLQLVRELFGLEPHKEPPRVAPEKNAAGAEDKLAEVRSIESARKRLKESRQSMRIGTRAARARASQTRLVERWLGGGELVVVRTRGDVMYEPSEH